MRLFKINAITGVGLVIIALALWNASTVVRFLMNSTHTKGTVVEMAQTKEGLWHPVIEFVATDGKTHKVEPGSASAAPGYRKGQSVEIVYTPDDPQDWSLTDFSDLWLGTTISLVLGGILAAIGYGFQSMGSDLSNPRGGKILELVGVAVIGGLGLLMMWGSWYVSRDTDEFTKYAVPAVGKIVEMRKSTSKDNKGNTTVSYYPTITFSTEEGESKTFRGNAALDELRYPVGKRIKVLYDRLDPQMARVDDADSRWGTPVLLACLGLFAITMAVLLYLIVYKNIEFDTYLFTASGFLVGAILLFALAWFMSRDSIYLAQHGRRATGTIIGFNPAPLIEFTAKDGTVVKYQSHVNDKSSDYAVGNSVRMLYDPLEPEKAVMYSFWDLWFGAVLAGGLGWICLSAVFYIVYRKMQEKRSVNE